MMRALPRLFRSCGSRVSQRLTERAVIEARKGLLGSSHTPDRGLPWGQAYQKRREIDQGQQRQDETVQLPDKSAFKPSLMVRAGEGVPFKSQRLLRRERRNSHLPVIAPTLNMDHVLMRHFRLHVGWRWLRHGGNIKRGSSVGIDGNVVSLESAHWLQATNRKLWLKMGTSFKDNDSDPEQMFKQGIPTSRTWAFKCILID